jgi:hypothetical protein
LISCSAEGACKHCKEFYFLRNADIAFIVSFVTVLTVTKQLSLDSFYRKWYTTGAREVRVEDRSKSNHITDLEGSRRLGLPDFKTIGT